ncbi:MAG: phytanoyl-CoA dioxygenase family protein [Chloroflexota bacterium]
MSHFLTDAQLEQFHEEGYLIVEDLFGEEDLTPVESEYAGVLDRLTDELYDEGQISSRYQDLPFGERLTKVYGESGKVHAQYFDFSLPKSNVKADTPMWVGPQVFHMMRNEKLLDVVESVIGSEIYSNPIQHVRLKPPERLTPKKADGRVQLGKTAVHQDLGVALPEADDTKMLTVWFSFNDTSIKNGCLRVWPHSHRRGLMHHCNTRGGLGVPGQLLEGKSIAAEMKRGSVLFMDKLTLHASHANNSDKIRFSFDLRYNPTGQRTGRPAFPGFVARSRQHPESEMRDPADWSQLWHDARTHLSTIEMDPFDRWDDTSPLCA